MNKWLHGFATVAILEFKGDELGSVRRWISLLTNPVSYLCFLGVGLAAQLGGSEYLAFLLPGVIVIQAISSMSSLIYRVVLERRWGLAALKLQAGVARSAYLLGLLSAPLVVYMARVLVLLTLGMVLSAPMSLVMWVNGLLTSLIAAVFWSLVGIVVAASIKDYRTRDFVVGLLMTPLMFAAPTFYPLDAAPAFLRIIARMNPLTYQVELLRSAMQGTLNVPALAISCALVLVAAVAAASYVRAMRKLSFEA